MYARILLNEKHCSRDDTFAKQIGYFIEIQGKKSVEQIKEVRRSFFIWPSMFVTEVV